MRAGPALAAALPEAWMTVVPGVACDLRSGEDTPQQDDKLAEVKSTEKAADDISDDLGLLAVPPRRRDSHTKVVNQGYDSTLQH